MEVEKIVRQSTLYDFYGALLTEHQQQIYEEIFFEDLSYAEAAEAHGISRQGVYDILKRCEKTLEEYETKMQLVARFQDVKGKVQEIQDRSKELEVLCHEEAKTLSARQMTEKQADLDRIQTLSEEILDVF